MKIRVVFDYPPIPIRDFDYSAHDEDRYDGAPDASARSQRIGRGRTATDAIYDLVELCVDDYTDEELAKAERQAVERSDAVTFEFVQRLREAVAA